MLENGRMLRAFLVRFAVPVMVVAALAAAVSMPIIDRLISEWFRGDMQLRSEAVLREVANPVNRLLDQNKQELLTQYLNRVGDDERLVALVVCSPRGGIEAATKSVPKGLECSRTQTGPEPASRVIKTSLGPVLVSEFPLTDVAEGGRSLLIAHDLSFVDHRRSTARDYTLAFIAVSAVVLSLLVVAAAWWAFQRWALALLNDVRGRRFREDATSAGLSLPILSQLRQVMREAEATQRLEIEYQENWTPSALQHVVRDYLGTSDMLIVSNREPYIHSLDAAGVPRAQVPASGMVTALEPVMRACEGTWIAHGSGNADRLVVDRHDRLSVPPGAPTYRLRRVWLTEAEETGYYYGFSNEGLWPLCHIAYVRPEFRESDWRQYVAVNEKFGAVVADEAHSDSPVVLIQDYHFALLPAQVRRRRPRATIVLFWHIPWPNAETFGVCPWKRELLAGMLQADVLGFHTRYHCQNFLAAIDRYVEGQIDHEQMTVTVRGHKCRVAPYPISIEWPPRFESQTPPAEQCRRAVRARFKIPAAARLGLGVERWDFTKGIPERLDALRYLLETRPLLRGRVTLLQVLAPSRSALPAYQALQERTRATVEAINGRFATADWQPVVLLAEHQDPAEVFELYRAADFCLVNSLHDGMNLVAKEFVAARDDEDGVLILSTFTGASRELVEALSVNPYDAIETAHAIETALAMSREERRERMRLMRRTVKHNNVFRWAGRILVDAAQIRQRQRLAERAAPPRKRVANLVDGQ